MLVCSKEREDVEEIQLCGEFMRGLGRVSVVVKFNAHGFVIAMPVLMDGQKVAWIPIDWKLLVEVLQLELQFRLVGDEPICVDFNYAAVVGLFDDAQVEGLHPIDEQPFDCLSFPHAPV
jgi:hypothetical protein